MLEIAAQRLVVVSDHEWENADGEIIDCERVRADRPTEIVFDPVHYELQVDGRDLPTAGRFVIDKRSSYESDYVAILSADGPDKGGLSLVGIGGRSAFAGQHYHQTFSVKEKKFVGPAVKLPFQTVEHDWLPCLVENRVVLYLEQQGDGIVAVPL